MIKDIFHAQEERMKKTLEALRRDFGSLRAGRATPALLDRVMVDYYGQPTPVSQVATIAVPEPRMLMITPWEKTARRCASRFRSSRRSAARSL